MDPRPEHVLATLNRDHARSRGVDRGLHADLVASPAHDAADQPPSRNRDELLEELLRRACGRVPTFSTELSAPTLRDPRRAPARLGLWNGERPGGAGARR